MPSRSPYRDIATDTRTFSQEIQRYYQANLREHGEFVRFEFINSAFFQSARAYLIGRTIQQDHVNPIIIALKNTSSGIEVDAVLLSEEEVSVVFSYTRSYYFANPHSVIARGAFPAFHSAQQNPSTSCTRCWGGCARARPNATVSFHTTCRPRKTGSCTPMEIKAW